ncbi:MAG: glycosyltransferase [Methanosarcinales archaeon]|nr:glycosyltransferase [Methanosarcinales archaeon]
MSKVLIISPDTIPIENHLAAGPGIRSWEIAKALHNYGHEITIAVPNDIYHSELTEFSGVKIKTWDFDTLIKLCNDKDAVIIPQGKIDLSDFFTKNINNNLCIIVDVYDPNLIEFLNLFSTDKDGIKTFSKCLTSIVPLLKRGDFFVCANNRQRYYYLGILNVLGRINPLTYNEKLIELVPFGVPDEDPVFETNDCVMRGSLVKNDDKVILWFGGIYPWFDAITLIKSLDIAVKKNPKIKLVIMGAIHPRGYTPTENYIKTLELSRQLGLYNKNVFFTDWRPYDERIYWYREADIGICTYPMHLETELSNRTRVIDMLWGNLPVITTDGDAVSALIKQYNCGETVKPNNPDKLAEVLLDILGDDEKRNNMVKNTKKLVNECLRWKIVVKPLAEFLDSPTIAKDRSNEFAANTLLWDIDTLERHRAYTPTEIVLLKQDLQEKDKQIRNLEQQLTLHIEAIRNKDETINIIHSGIAWKLLMKFAATRKILLPDGTRRHHYFNKGLKLLTIIYEEGWRRFCLELLQSFKSNISKDYYHWISKNEPKKEDLKKMMDDCKIFRYKPKISVIIPVWNTEEKMLRSAINSVLKQLYDNYEICIVDGGSTNPNVKKVLNEYINKDLRINVKFLSENKGIAANSNEALCLATGEYIAFLDHDDELSPFALYEIVKVLNENPEANLIYSDEDRLDKNGNRINPFFKPDWSLPMLLSTNYICHFLVYRNSLIQKVAGFREGFEGAQDYDLALRIVEKIPSDSIHHIPKILYHWRETPLSSASGRAAKPYAYAAGKKALEEYLLRNHIEGEVQELNDPGSYRVDKKIIPVPSIDLIIIADILDKYSIKNIQKNFTELMSATKYKPSNIYAPYDMNLHGVLTYSVISNEQLNSIIQKYNSDYIIFIDSSSLSKESLGQLSSDWVEALIEHFPYFHVGIVGTGTFIFSNIVHNIHRPSGRTFAISRKLLQLYLENRVIPANFDDLQIALADFAKSFGYENLFTPHSFANQFDRRKIDQYYLDLNNNYLFTDNMKYYLPSFEK